MKKFAIVIVAAIALSGCASIRNPVDRSQVDTAKAAYVTLLSAAVAYRDLCAKKIIERVKCAPVVMKLQAADRKVQVALRNLDAFVRQNPTINAVSLVTAVKDAVDDFQAVANTEGVR